MRLVALLAILLVSCYPADEEAIGRFAHDDDEQTALTFLRHVRGGDYGEANRYLALALHDSVPDSAWAGLRATLQKTLLDSLYLVGANTYSSGGVRSSRLTYEAPAADGWIRGSVELHHRDVQGAQFFIVDESLSVENAFRLTGLSAGHYLFALIALGTVVFSLGTITILLRSGMPKRKRWALASLVGVSGATLNWTSGVMTTHIVKIGVPVVQVTQASIFSPWMVSLTFPIGAILALQKLNQYRSGGPEEFVGNTEPLEGREIA